MIFLSQPTLQLSLLDPADPVDRLRQGTRYCWGGYIWQVTDSVVGPVFAGPQWPEADPTAFNGQGLPESFRHAEFGTNRSLMLEDSRGFIIGIGDVAPDSEGELAVTKPCDWTVTRSADAIEFCTAQSGNGYACQVTRKVGLSGRTVSSATAITNTGSRPIPLHWFAHPFFALTDRVLTCSIPREWDLRENAGYAFDRERRIVFKRRFKDIYDGHFEQLVVGPSTPLRAGISHPRLSEIVFTTDFVPDSCPIWGNSSTWSIEPYIASTLAPGSRRTWELKYVIGPKA